MFGHADGQRDALLTAPRHLAQSVDHAVGGRIRDRDHGVQRPVAAIAERTDARVQASRCARRDLARLSGSASRSGRLDVAAPPVGRIATVRRGRRGGRRRRRTRGARLMLSSSGSVASPFASIAEEVLDDVRLLQSFDQLVLLDRDGDVRRRPPSEAVSAPGTGADTETTKRPSCSSPASSGANMAKIGAPSPQSVVARWRAPSGSRARRSRSTSYHSVRVSMFRSSRRGGFASRSRSRLSPSAR